MSRRLFVPTVLILAASALIGGLATAAPGWRTTAPAEFSVDTVHSCVLFRIRHNNVGNFYGRFNDFSGTITYDEEAGTLVGLEMTVKADSVDTANSGRDNHIKSADYFDTGTHPVMTFKATAPAEASAGKVSKLAGELTYKGVTKNVTADLEWIGAQEGRRGKQIGFEARLTFKRTDFDPDASVGGVSDEVLLIVAVEGRQRRSQ